MQVYSEQQVADIIKWRDEGFSWRDVCEKYGKRYGASVSEDAIRKTYNRYQNIFHSDEDKVKILRTTHGAKKRSSANARENRSILDQWERRDNLLEALQAAVKAASAAKVRLPKPRASKSKKRMTLELLASDIHYGKYVDSIPGNKVDVQEIRRRVRIMRDVTVEEMKAAGKIYNVERVILALLGDIIENADFHGEESTKGCEFSTARQVQEAIESLYEDLILPIAVTGIQVDIPCITGNHDRIGRNKTYQKPGEDNLSYIIYSTLKMLCKQAGLKNVTFDIATSPYTHTEVYGSTIVYEHGDEVKNINRATLHNQMQKRQAQVGKVVDFFRIGHWHEPTHYGQGRMIINGSVPGQDSYADALGFLSEPVQILNFYVETKNRDNCFYRTLPIFLKEK